MQYIKTEKKRHGSHYILLYCIIDYMSDDEVQLILKFITNILICSSCFIMVHMEMIDKAI